MYKRTLQWGLDSQTLSDFQWSKVVWMMNGSDFEWHSKTKQPDHSKSDQKATILDSYFLVLLSYSSDHLKTVAMILIIIIPNHPKSDHKNVWI